MESQAKTVAKLAIIHVGGLFAATMAIITIIETINAISIWRQAKRDGL
jgi:hypothetical protein